MRVFRHEVVCSALAKMPVPTSRSRAGLGGRHLLCCVVIPCVIAFLQNSVVSAKCLVELDQLVAARNPLQQKQKQESAGSEEPIDGTALQQP